MALSDISAAMYRLRQRSLFIRVTMLIVVGAVAVAFVASKERENGQNVQATITAGYSPTTLHHPAQIEIPVSLLRHVVGYPGRGGEIVASGEFTYDESKDVGSLITTHVVLRTPSRVVCSGGQFALQWAGPQALGSVTAGWGIILRFRPDCAVRQFQADTPLPIPSSVSRLIGRTGLQ